MSVRTAGKGSGRRASTGSDRKGEVVIPFVTEIVPTVDVRAGLVIIDAPTGLLAGDVVEEDEE